jgi:hypothetical protein
MNEVHAKNVGAVYREPRSAKPAKPARPRPAKATGFSTNGN